jgi:hypothetical protein
VDIAGGVAVERQFQRCPDTAQEKEEGKQVNQRG